MGNVNSLNCSYTIILYRVEMLDRGGFMPCINSRNTIEEKPDYYFNHWYYFALARFE